jgi:hypothetical protein
MGGKENGFAVAYKDYPFVAGVGDVRDMVYSSSTSSGGSRSKDDSSDEASPEK